MYEVEEKIEDAIYEINGKQVILDFDLTRLYEVDIKRIHKTVKNNPEESPETFS